MSMTNGTLAKQVRRKDLTFLQKSYIPEILKGMVLTMKQIFRPKFTRQYPEERWNPPSSFRGRPVLVEEDSVERCVACGLCARVCPALAIEVQASETDLEKERYPVKFEINMLRCIFCGYCQEVCPEEAIFLMRDYSLNGSTREEMIYNKEKLLALGGVHQDTIQKWKHKAEEARSQGVKP
jgi:NADH-quinone oxidoreductase subunit I